MWRAALAMLLLAPATGWAQELPGWAPEQRDVAIPLRDGQALAADVFLPPTPGRYPTVLIQTPYNKRGLGSPMTGRGRREGLFDRVHYATVVVDWRGFYGSRAAKTAARGTGGRDGYDCVEWIAAQSWSDGKVGTWGPSALGKIQFDTAMERPPHLVCCVPVIAAMGQQQRFYYEGGVLRESHVQSLDRLGFGVGTLVRQSADRPALWRLVERRTVRPDRVAVPMLLITGWWDHFPDAILDTFTDLRARSAADVRSAHRLLIGPWDHMSVGQARQGEWDFPDAAPENERSVRLFLDYWLRGCTDNGWADEAPVRYWSINGAGWTTVEAWPGVAITEQTWVLPPGPTLERASPSGSVSAPLRTIAIDPQDVAPTLGGANLPPLAHGPVDQAPLLTRADVAGWHTPTLAAPMRIVGAMRVQLRCRADGPDFDLAVRVGVGGSDGRIQLLGDTIRRVSAHGAAHGGGYTADVEFRVPSTAATVPAGSQLWILVAGGNYPRFARNPAITGPVRVTFLAEGCRAMIPVALPK